MDKQMGRSDHFESFGFLQILRWDVEALCCIRANRFYAIA